MDTINKIEKLIEKAMAEPEFELNRQSDYTFSIDDKDWHYYFYFCGFYKGSYFNLGFRRHKIGNTEKHEINSDVTERALVLLEFLNSIDSSLNIKIS